MTVIAIERGSETGITVMIEFNVDDVQHALVSKWNKRNKSTQYALSYWRGQAEFG